MEYTNNEPVNATLKTNDSKPTDKRHRCQWCNDLFPESKLHLEADLGFLCDRCIMALRSRGENLTLMN